MKCKIIFSLIILAITCPRLEARINVVTTYGYLADITARIGGDSVSVSSMAQGARDPHAIVPRPSLIARLRTADLLIINGAHLEIGWVPPLLNDSNNRGIQPGQPGFLDISAHVKKIQIPAAVSRAQGDVHPEGNPHFYLDPENIPRVSDAIAQKLASLDGSHAASYRKNNDTFKSQWRIKTDEWGRRLAPMRGVKVIQYHRLFDYYLQRYGIEVRGEIEPLPGITATSRHMESLIQLAKSESVQYILQDVYHSPDAAKFLSGRTGTRLIVLPHDVGAVREATDIFTLFDEIARRLAP